MKVEGFIFKIGNDMNDRIYIGETTRTLDLRFNEICFDTRSTSIIHKAIQENGWQHFRIDLIEEVPISQLYERKEYWIKYYNSYERGYNENPIRQGVNDSTILVVEPNIIFNNAESMGAAISNITSWNKNFCLDKIIDAIKNNNLFLDYHLQSINGEVSSIDEQENWIKILNVQYAGKHIYCGKLDKKFGSAAQAAQYFIDNGYYIGNSKYPIQDLITSIGQNIKGKIDEVSSLKNSLTFEEMPGSLEEEAQELKIRCVELNKIFNSSEEAAQYMLDNSFWSGIKLKTARTKIDNIINKIFNSYKGYSFEYI